MNKDLDYYSSWSNDALYDEALKLLDEVEILIDKMFNSIRGEGDRP